MEDNNQEPYQDSPLISPPSSPNTVNTVPSIKQSNLVPDQALDSRDDRYGDETLADPSLASPRPQRYHANPSERRYYPPYSDARSSSSRDSDDDVPLAHLYLYPTEAPPPYADVVTQSYRNTLISHIPMNSTVSADTESEAGVEREHPDEGRYTAERLMARLILVIFLLLVSSTLVSFILFGKPFGGKS